MAKGQRWNGTGSSPRTRAIAEQKRRRDIVRRYVTIGAPTSADDAVFAAELGLSVDSLVRMASALRRHGPNAPLPGTRVRTTKGMRESALAALRCEPDLSGVVDRNASLVRVRVEAMRSYLAIRRPTETDLADAAREAGLHPQRFRTMLRSRILLRDVTAIPGAAPLPKTPRKNPDERDRSGRLMRQALLELGVDARGKDVHARVAELCVAVGLTAPSAPVVYQRLRSIRPRRGRRRREA